MSNFDPDGSSENQWDDRGELAWNEFDWERYLRDQDELILRYLRFYETSKRTPDRIDKVAEKMNWGQGDWSDESGAADIDDADEIDDEDEDDVYTLHKNPIFIATKAIYLSIGRSWELIAVDPAQVEQSLAVNMLTSLHGGEEQAVQAIHALDFGDYAMAVSLFKRAMSALNGTLALMNTDAMDRLPRIRAWREEAMSRCFDLREIWLRVIAECRDELDRPIEDESS